MKGLDHGNASGEVMMQQEFKATGRSLPAAYISDATLKGKTHTLKGINLYCRKGLKYVEELGLLTYASLVVCTSCFFIQAPMGS